MALNLHTMARGFVAIVTGAVKGIWKSNTGAAATDAAGNRVPVYVDTPDFDMRVQAMSGTELQLMDGLNIQGIKRAVWANGDVQGVDRKTGKGGDLLVFHGAVWLVQVVIETWDDSGWCKVGVTKQMDVVA